MTSIRRADVLWRATLDGVLIRPLGAAEVIKLAGTGLTLWGALDEPSTFEALCSTLAATHDADPAVVAGDLRPVIDDLAARGVLDLIDG